MPKTAADKPIADRLSAIGYSHRRDAKSANDTRRILYLSPKTELRFPRCRVIFKKASLFSGLARRAVNGRNTSQAFAVNRFLIGS